MGLAQHDVVAVGGAVGVGVAGQGEVLAQEEHGVGEELGGHVGQVAALGQVGPVPAAPLAAAAQVGPHPAAAA